MKFTEYILKNQVFTTEDLTCSVDSPNAAREQLRVATKKGTVISVRRGLYVSRKGFFDGVEPDPFKLPWAADCQCVFSFHSALALHGVAHSLSFECRFQSKRIVKDFSYGSMRYKPLPMRPNVQTRSMRRDDFVLFVTTKEQTLLDCLERPSFAGGLEEVLRSVSSFTYLDLETLVSLASNASATLCARLGWLLEMKQKDWRVTDTILERLHRNLHSGPYLMGNSKESKCFYVRKWRLYLPADKEEVLSWIQH